jgi:anti-sigma factor RsiW
VTCDRIRNQLGAFADRELSATERSAVEEHLRSCEKCREEMARLERLASTVQESVIPEVPAGLAARIVARGQTQLASPKPRRLLHIDWWEALPSTMRAAAVIVLMVGLSVGTWLGWNSAGVTRVPMVAATVPDPDPASSIHADYLSDSPGGSPAEVYLTLAAPTDGGR